MGKIAEQLQKLTEQLNQFRLASEENVGEVRKQVSEQFEQRLELQSSRIDVVNESVKKSQKASEDNTDLLQNLLVGIENMWENFKNSGKMWNSGKVQSTNVNAGTYVHGLTLQHFRVQLGFQFT